MTKYFCDRCQAQVTPPAKLHNISLADQHGNSRKYELCTPCLHRLHEWLQPQPREERG